MKKIQLHYTGIQYAGLGAMVLFLGFVTEVQATPVTIVDNYVGGGATSPGHATHDVIGSQTKFEISQMTVNHTGSTLEVDITSTYFDDVGFLGTTLGDLFISADGWSPDGAAPHYDDNYQTGEDWEYAVVIDDHGEQYATDNKGYSMIGASGNLSLYEVADKDNIELSNSRHPHRAEQEFLYSPDGQNAISGGSWQILQGQDGFDILRLLIYLNGTPLSVGGEWGYHWGYSCANDVIEGSAQHQVEAAEASTLLLLSLGIYSLKRTKRKNTRAKS